jgi:hypothetical protein
MPAFGGEAVRQPSLYEFFEKQKFVSPESKTANRICYFRWDTTGKRLIFLESNRPSHYRLSHCFAWLGKALSGPPAHHEIFELFGHFAEDPRLNTRDGQQKASGPLRRCSRYDVVSAV